MTLAERLEAEGNALVATLGDVRHEGEELRAALANNAATLFETEMVHRRAIAAARKGSCVRHLMAGETTGRVATVRDGAGVKPAERPLPEVFAARPPAGAQDLTRKKLERPSSWWTWPPRWPRSKGAR